MFIEREGDMKEKNVNKEIVAMNYKVDIHLLLLVCT